MTAEGGERGARHLVLVGGGHSHVEVLRRFGMAPLPGLVLTLVNPAPHAPYSGMLPGLIAGHYGFADAHIDLVRLAGFAGARLALDEATALDLARRRVRCRSGAALPFDVVSLDIGATPRTDEVPGAAEHAVPVKPIAGFLERWRSLCLRVMAAGGRSRIAVVGAGAGGVEVLLAAQFRLRQAFAAAGRTGEEPEFHLFADGEDILPALPIGARRRFRRILGERGVRLHLGAAVGAVAPGRLTTCDGQGHDCDEILWATAAGAARWLSGSGLALDAGGFVAVADTLRSLSDPAVFAAGDIAGVVGHERPKAGVFAVRQGPPLAANLRRALLGQPLRPFVPQRHFLGLISTGDRYAVATRGRRALGGWNAVGDLLWRLKDRIDRAFVARYSRGVASR